MHKTSEALRRFTRKWVIYFLSSLIAFAAILAVVLLSLFDIDTGAMLSKQHSRIVTVPNFVGMIVDDAMSLSGGDFVIHTTNERESKSPAGTVLSQFPVAGARRKLSISPCEVEVTISSAIPAVVLDDLRGLSAEKAMLSLEKAGLRGVFKDHEGTSAGIPYRHVCVTSPVFGTTLHHGDTVTLYLSTEIQSSAVTCPDLLGMRLPDAKATLERLGLGIGDILKEGEYRSFDADYSFEVLSQDIPEGTKICTEERINLTVRHIEESISDKLFPWLENNFTNDKILIFDNKNSWKDRFTDDIFAKRQDNKMRRWALHRFS